MIVQNLSPREIAVMRAYAAHLSSEDIQDQLGISAGTVRKYLHTARTKLGGHNKREAIHRFLALYGDPGPTDRSTANDWADKPAVQNATLAPVERAAGNSLNDIAVDHAQPGSLEDHRTSVKALRELLHQIRPDVLSLAMRNALILASIVVAGAVFFVINVGAAALRPLANSVRALFP